MTSERRAAVDAARAKATQAFAESLRDKLMAAWASGAVTDREVSVAFDTQGLRTRRNKRWTHAAVKYLTALLGVGSLSPKLSPNRFAESLRPAVKAARQQGITSHHGLADYLTERGIRAFKGLRTWDHDSAGRPLARLKKLAQPEPR